MKDYWSSQQTVSFCLTAVLCLAVVAALGGRARAAMDGVEFIALENPFGGWPTALPDGRLMLWWTQDKPDATDDTGSVQQAFARYSSDNGVTWSEPQFLFEFPRSEGKCRYTRDCNGITLCDTDGVLHIFGTYFCDWSWEEFAGASSAFHAMSADGGKTWSEVQLLDTGYQYGSVQTALLLRSGRIVVPFWFASETKRGQWAVICSISDDGGKSWHAAQEAMLSDDVSLDEAVGVELRDGRLWLLFRTDQGYLYQGFSSDGDTWTEAQPSRFVSPSAPAGVLRLRDGRIIVVWNNSLKPKHVLNRLVLAAAISDDEGQTWQGYREMARTDGVKGPGGRPCYPWLTQAADGTVIVAYRMVGSVETQMLRLDLEWLAETSFRDDFSEGLANWITVQTEGATVAPHPTRRNRQALALRKPNPEVASGASLNFPFGAQGHLTTRIRLEPGFDGTRMCLTDHFTYPSYAEDGRFGISIAADGLISVGTGEGEFRATDVTLKTGKWHTLGFAWDCEKGTCRLTINHRHVADLPQLSVAPGVCYLRLWSAATETDEAGMLVDSVSVAVKP